MKPVRPDMTQPSDEGERAEEAGLAERQRVRCSFGFTTATDVRNTTTASGMRMRTIVLNWRFR